MDIPHNHPEKENPLDYNYIDDGIYVGTNQCCQTHFDEELTEKGVTEDISLEEERVDMPFGVNSYLWIPVTDHTPPTPDQLEIGVSAIEKLVSLDKKVYVHCKNGHGRAPTLVSAYLIRNKKMAPEDAVNFIKEKRPTIHLEVSQKEALQAFHKINS